MTAKAYDNTKHYNVTVTAIVNRNKTLAEDLFQTEVAVTSPKTGRVLRGVRIDYLNSDNIYQFENRGPVSGIETLSKILKGFETATRKTGVTMYHDELTAVCKLTAHDLRCIQLAWSGWQDRQRDYAD